MGYCRCPGNVNMIKIICILVCLIVIVLVVITFRPALYTDNSSYFRGYVPNNSEYSVHNDSGHSARNSESPCTFKFLREYYEKYKSFPGKGTWNSTTQSPYYQLEACKLRQTPIGKDDLRSCLRGSGTRSIMTMGDSNAIQYAYILAKNFFEDCKRLKSEKLSGNAFIPDKNYFQASNRTKSDWERYVQVHYRFCSGCASFRSFCDATNVTLEHIANTMILDDSMQIHMPTYKETRHTLNTLWALTSQELILRYYLRNINIDVLWLFLPFNHAKHVDSDRVKVDIAYFVSLVRLYVPSSTRVFYMPTYGEYESRRSGLAKEWKNVRYEGMLATEKIEKLNQIMFDVLEKDLLNSSKNVYGFLDLIAMSRPLESWSRDGIHMAEKWYNTIMSIFWDIYCNSVRLDAF